MDKMLKFSFFIMLTLGFTIMSCETSNKDSEKKFIENIPSYYKCPMDCSEETFENQGVCPICDMELIEISEG